MESMAPSAFALVPIVVVLLLAGSALWVYRDATVRAERGTPVSFSAGSLQITTPATWAVGCLFVWVLFLPLYLTCRNGAR